MAHEPILIGSRVALSELVEDLLLIEQLMIRFEVEVAEILDIRSIFRRPAIPLPFFLFLLLSTSLFHGAFALWT
jgi:hypothetical protein